MSSVISPAPIASVRLTKKTLPLGVSRCRTSAFFSRFTLLGSASEARHVRFRAAVGAQRTSGAGSITDLMHDPMTPASPVALRDDVTWLSPLRLAPRVRRRQAGSRCKNYGLPVPVQID